MRAIAKSVSLLCALFSTGIFACDEPASVCFKDNGGISLIKNNQPLPVIISPGANAAVKRVAKSFSEDLTRVGGGKSELTETQRLNKAAIIIGVPGEDALIDSLVKEGKLDISGIRNKWEAYQITVVDDPAPGVGRALVVVGSDRRGAIFGTFDISERMGVSPWHWFADVPVKQHANVFITPGTRSDYPKVRYRGIFINDEDPALKGWAQKTFGGVNSGMYEHVFDLILRLKGNYIWPAMWGKAFHLDDPKNTSLADDMGIVMGTSHHEPMTRAHAEWHRKSENPSGGGAWNYETNREAIQQFWRGGIERMMSKGDGKPYESLVTVGMRGDGDEPMSEGTAIKLLETVVDDQRKIIEDVTGEPAEKTPQVWALYKEVQDYYDNGMTVPDDVTLLFADDNWGQVRRLPVKDVDREGGFGVYYHFDYVGGPRSYKWTNTVQIGKVWQQMNLSYERGAKNLWVVNVGDLKPIEYPTDFFLTMAWDPEKVGPQDLREYAIQFAEQSFSADLAKDIASLLERYGTLAAMRKPELLNQDTFEVGEPTLPDLQPGEFYQHYIKWKQLETDMDEVKEKIDEEHYPAFFQLVEWPVASLSNLYEMYFAAAWNKKLADADDSRANYFKDIVEKNFAKDKVLTEKYHSINNGKWDGMINQVHMNYITWSDPAQQTMPDVIAVDKGKNDIKVSFRERVHPNDGQIIEAKDFVRATGNKSLSWQAVDHLGQSEAGVLALPQGHAATTFEDKVTLSYDLRQPYDGNAIIKIKLSPTLDTYGRGGIRIGVAVDERPPETLSFDLHPSGGAYLTEEEKAWAAAVVTNEYTLKWNVENLKKGSHTVTIYRIDDNVVLENIHVSFSKQSKSE